MPASSSRGASTRRQRRRKPRAADLAARRSRDSPPNDLPAYARRGTVQSDVPQVIVTEESPLAGLTRWQVLDGTNLFAPARGVRIVPHRTTVIEHPAWADDAWFATRARVAAVQSRRPEAVASHQTAALLLGLPVPASARKAEATIHVLAPPTAPVRWAGVRGHRGHRTESPIAMGGVRVCGIRQTLVQLAAALTERNLLIALEAALGPWHGDAITQQSMLAHLQAHPGSRGTARLRSTLSRARPGVGSPKESELRLDLMELGFPEPTVGATIWTESLRRHLTPDLLYRQIATAIEYEGEHHLVNRSQHNFDIRRIRALQNEGYFVERVVSGVPLVDLIMTLHARFAALAAGTFIPPPREGAS